MGIVGTSDRGAKIVVADSRVFLDGLPSGGIDDCIDIHPIPLVVSVSYGSAGSVSADPALSDDLHRSHMLAGCRPAQPRSSRSCGSCAPRGEREQRATFFQLFFDLVYVFAITQLSHHLLADLSWAGAAQTVFMLVAV